MSKNQTELTIKQIIDSKAELKNLSIFGIAKFISSSRKLQGKNTCKKVQTIKRKNVFIL